MPGWYVHMEAARLAAERLAAADVPADHGLDPAEARRLGALARTWRNYLAVGALGPDLFYLLPDFKAPVGGPLLGVAGWVLNAWEAVERSAMNERARSRDAARSGARVRRWAPRCGKSCRPMPAVPRSIGSSTLSIWPSTTISGAAETTSSS